MSHTSGRNRFLGRAAAAEIVFVVALVLGCSLPAAGAEDFPGLANPYAPLISQPAFHVETKVRPIFVGVTSGKVTMPSTSSEWGLKEAFGMDQTFLFLDSMVRFQFGRFSFRCIYEPREIVGETNFQHDPAAPKAQARLDYSGLRLGADADLYQWGMSRIGLNFDQDLYPMIFSEANETPGGVKFQGKEVATLGVHAVYNPISTWYGVSGVVELRARWAVSHTKVTDVAVSAGVKTPETILGALSWRVGYRSTAFELSGANRTLDGILGGWFGEVAYFF
ncbi:MAG: hypothetical protein HY914_09955 [Desulfomonile tiedjei]|nr:hypothetical protein [Desulfomonile tiedjei]